MFSQIFLLTLWATYVWTDCDLDKLFKDTKIIPDMLQTAPTEMLKLEFENGLIVGNGKEFTPTQTKDIPTIDWSADPNKYYFVYMGSPDAPDVANPKWGEFLHWLVVNVPGKDVARGEVYCPYIGPLTPKTGGLMRYVFLVYEQPGKIEFNETHVDNTKLDGHLNYKIEKVAEKYKLGPPLAGNVFRSQWDAFVPTLHRQMGVTMDE